MFLSGTVDYFARNRSEEHKCKPTAVFFSGQGFIKKYDEKAYDIFKTILEEGALGTILPLPDSGV